MRSPPGDVVDWIAKGSIFCCKGIVGSRDRNLNPLRRDPRGLEHVRAFLVGVGGGAALDLLAAVERVPHVVPLAAGRSLGIFGRAGFEEVGVLDAVEQRGEPGEGGASSKMSEYQYRGRAPQGGHFFFDLIPKKNDPPRKK